MQNRQGQLQLQLRTDAPVALPPEVKTHVVELLARLLLEVAGNDETGRRGGRDEHEDS